MIFSAWRVIVDSFLTEVLLLTVDSGCSLQEIEKNFTITNALTWVTVTWPTLSQMTIKKCFPKAGFMFNVDANGFEEEDNIPLAQLFPTIKHILVDLEQFALIDSDVPTERG